MLSEKLTTYLKALQAKAPLKDIHNKVVNWKRLYAQATIAQALGPLYFSSDHQDLAYICKYHKSPTLLRRDYNIKFDPNNPLPNFTFTNLFTRREDWVYFQEEIPAVKKHFHYHQTLYLTAQARKLITKLANSKDQNIKSGDVAALKLLLEEANKQLAHQAQPNKGKIFMYYPPQYLSDLLNEDLSKVKAHKSYLQGNLQETFTKEGELKTELLSPTLKNHHQREQDEN